MVFGLSACQATPQIQPVVAPFAASPTATPFPTPAASFSGDDLADRTALLQRLPPQAGKVALSRVEALIQTHDFAEAYTLALEDNYIPREELTVLIQLAANARASLYSTGQSDMIQFANRAGWLTDLAVHGDWEAAKEGIRLFRRSLPRKPSL